MPISVERRDGNRRQEGGKSACRWCGTAQARDKIGFQGGERPAPSPKRGGGRPSYWAALRGLQGRRSTCRAQEARAHMAVSGVNMTPPPHGVCTTQHAGTTTGEREPYGLHAERVVPKEPIDLKLVPRPTQLGRPCAHGTVARVWGAVQEKQINLVLIQGRERDQAAPGFLSPLSKPRASHMRDLGLECVEGGIAVTCTGWLVAGNERRVHIS